MLPAPANTCRSKLTVKYIQNRMNPFLPLHVYVYRSPNNQASQGGSTGNSGMMAGQSAYSAQSQQGSLNNPAASPAFAPEQSRPSVSPVMPAAPTTTQQICSCITINPAASSAHQSAPVASSAAAESSAQAAASAAEQQQTFSAPAAAQSFAAQSAPAQSYSSAAAQQTATAQRAY